MASTSTVKISSNLDFVIAAKVEFGYLYFQTKNFVQMGERHKYKTLLLEICTSVLGMRTRHLQWNEIFIGQIRDTSRQGRRELKHLADVKIRLPVPSEGEAATYVKKEFAKFLKDYVDREEYQITEESGTYTIYKIQHSKNDCIHHIAYTIFRIISYISYYICYVTYVLLYYIAYIILHIILYIISHISLRIILYILYYTYYVTYIILRIIIYILYYIYNARYILLYITYLLFYYILHILEFMILICFVFIFLHVIIIKNQE